MCVDTSIRNWWHKIDIFMIEGKGGELTVDMVRNHWSLYTRQVKSHVVYSKFTNEYKSSSIIITLTENELQYPTCVFIIRQKRGQ